MLLVAREARKLVADLDHTVSTNFDSISITKTVLEANRLLIGFEEEANFTVIYYWHIFVLCSFLGRQLNMRIDPGL